MEGLSGLQDVAGANSLALAEGLDARVVVVLGYSSGAVADEARTARNLFGDRLAGVIINGVTRYKVREVKEVQAPALEADGISVLATIPEDRRLLGMSVEQLADHLGGRFLSWEEKKDNFVEHFLIGGLVLDWGVLYFERHENKAVIVRGDKPDIQMAALTTPTSCIVLTAGQPPIQYVQYEASQEEVPLIQVDTDTLETAEALESLQGKALFDHPVKQGQFMELMSRHSNWDAVVPVAGRIAQDAGVGAPSSSLPTQTSPPSKTSFFQMGVICLILSTMYAPASKASRLWGEARATTKLISPMSTLPIR